MDGQTEWRFCHKCNSMFFNGFPTKGVCKAGGGHEAAGFIFVLPHDVQETPTAQAAWRFCHKCNGMFFDGFPTKGACPAGGGHEAAGFMFVLPHDVQETPTAQAAWRFCHKCNVMFFDGFSGKGVCPAGGGHEAAGFMFVLPHLDDQTISFDSGPLTCGLPLGGSVHVVMRRNGNFTFSCHAHDSGFDNIDYTISAAVMSASGIAFTFTHSGHVEGTSAGLPFGTPTRDSNFIMSGTNPAVTSEFDGLIQGAAIHASINGTDKLVGGITGALGDVVKDVAQQLGKAAAAAVVALVV